MNEDDAGARAGDIGNDDDAGMHECGFIEAGWPDVDEVLAVHDLEASYSAALDAITPASYLSFLKMVPTRHRHVILNAVNLGRSTRLNRGIASAVLNRLRHPSSAGSLVDMSSPGVSTLLRHAEHDVDAWTSLAQGHGNGPTVSINGWTAAELAADIQHEDPALVRLGLALGVERYHNPVMALWFLSAYDETAAAAYARLRHGYPSIPEGPGRRFEAVEFFPYEDEATLPVPESEAEPRPDTTVPSVDVAAAEPMSGAEVTDLRELVEGLEWDVALGHALAVLNAVEAQSAPEPEVLESLTSFAAEVRSLASRLAVLSGVDVEARAATLLAAVDALEDLASHRSVLARVAEVEGPAQFAAPLQQVRDLAIEELAAGADPVLRDGLVALYHLALQCAARKTGGEVDFLAVGELDSAARAGLPTAVHPVILAANLGDLTFPESVDIGTILVTPTSTPEPEVSPAPEPTPAVLEKEFLERDARPAESTREATGRDEHAPQRATASDAEGMHDTTAVPVEIPPPNDANGSTTESEIPDLPSEPTDPAEIDADIQSEEEEEEDLERLLLADLTAAQGPLRLSSDIDASEPAVQLDSAVAAIPGPPESHPPAGATSSDGGAITPDSSHVEQWLLEARLLRTGRFGLAAHLHRNDAHRAARELAAYQQYLTQPAGQLAAAFATSAGQISRDELSDDRPGQLLAWAAAVRVAIIAPASGASGVLAELAPCVAGTPALAAVGDAFALAAQHGAFALPELAGALSTLGDSETRLASAIDAARARVNDAPRRKIKYTPANGVYSSWMEPSGPLGELLRTAASDDSDRAGEVLTTVAKLRGAAETSINATFSAQRNRNRKDKIVGGARSTLTTLWEEALDTAAEWASSAQAASEASSKLRDGNTRLSRPLETLRRTLAEHRDDALAELDELISDQAFVAADDGSAAESGAEHARADCESAAAAAVLVMLNAALATADGHPPTGDEPAPSWPRNGDLLATDLPLDAVTLEPVPASLSLSGRPAHEELLEAIGRLASRPFDVDATYALRATQRQHHLTAALVDNLALSAPEEAARLRSRRDVDVSEQISELSRRLTEVKASVRAQQREATVPMEVATTMLATISAIRPTSRYDFARAHAELDALEDDLRAHHADQVIAAREQIATASKSNSSVGANAELLLSMVEEGQVAGALEYLEQLLTTGALPEPRREGHHFDRFFPAVVDHAAAHPNLLPELAETLHGRPVSRAVATLEDLSEAALADQPEGARRVAAAALGAWQTMASNRRPDVDTVLKAVLSLAGYEYKSRGDVSKPAQGRQWIRLSGVTGVGQALVPALGSQMSRGGSTLRVLVVYKVTNPATIIEWLREERVEETVVVLHLAGTYTTAERRMLAEAARGRPRPVTIVIDPAVMTYLAVQPEALRATMAALTLPFTAESPYQDRAGRTAPEMFYGRTAERDAVMNLEGPSFVSGGRQLGKSALLWSAKEKFDDGHHHRAVMAEIRVVGADADPEQVWPRLASVLHDADILSNFVAGTPVDAETVPAAINAWLDADTDRRLLVLLDEADLFLDADAENNAFRNIDAMKRLMDTTGRRVKFVLAGLHRVVRFESLANQPLAHLGKQVTIGPLRAQAAYDLVTRPMSALGYRFADDHTGPARALAFTNNVPSLLQLFGQALMRRLTARSVGDGPPTLITDDDITAVIEDTDLAEQFRNKYLLTLRLDPRYLVIVYTVAFNALAEEADLGMTLPEIEESCRSWWPEGFGDVTLDHLRALVTECCDLGVLAHDRGRYRMRTQTMLRLLGSLETVEETLLGASSNLLLPASNDTSSYRAPMPNSHNRSPLTSRQLSEILNARGTAFVIAGSAGTGVARVPNALEALEHQGASRGLRVHRPSASTSPDQLRAMAGRLIGEVLIVLDARGHSPARLKELLETATAVTEARPEDLVVVLAADQSSAPVWTSSPALVELARVDAGGLRLWCDEVSAPFHTAEDQNALLRASGGWPKLLTSALNESGIDHAEDRLAALTADLSKPGRARDLLIEAGVGLAGNPSEDEGVDVGWVMSAFFRAVATLTGGDVADGAPLSDLADALRDETIIGPDLEPCTLQEAAQSVGFLDADDVLVALRACGALSTGAAGSMASEPLLTAAAQFAVEGLSG